jgi:hypothetical protein
MIESSDTTITPKVNIINQSNISTPNTNGFYLKIYKDSVSSNNVIGNQFPIN